MSGTAYGIRTAKALLSQSQRRPDSPATFTQPDADYTWWPADMVRAEELGSQTISFGYDARDRLLDINNMASSTPCFSATYTYLANGNINVAQFRQPDSPHAHKRYR